MRPARHNEKQTIIFFLAKQECAAKLNQNEEHLKLIGIGELEGVKNAFIGTLVEQADKDYISARANFKIELYDQFYWSGLQALEKYIKAILLYHSISTLKINHDLEKGLSQILKIQDIPWDFDDSFHKTVAYFSYYGNNRYFQKPRCPRGTDIHRLDAAVWSIRRYCQNFPFLREVHGNETVKQCIDYLQDPEFKANPTKFCSNYREHLEKVLYTNKYSLQKSFLIWNNRYYGLRRKNKVKLNHSSMYSEPEHFVYPALLSWLKDKFRIEKDILTRLEQNTRK